MRARSTPAVVSGGGGGGGGGGGRERDRILLLVGFWTVLKQLGFFI